MPRVTRNTLIAAKLETTSGTDALPTGAANAILISEQNVTPVDAKGVDRNVIRGYMGASEQLVGTISKKVSFSVELAGSGTAGTAPAYDSLLQACGMSAALLSTPARVEYAPVSSGMKTCTIYYYDDGVLHKLVGAKGTFTLSAKIGEIPKLKFEFTGLDGGDVTGTDTGNFSSFKKPVVMTKTNVTDILFGGTYAAGAVTGGQGYISTGIELQLGNSVNYIPTLSGEGIDITDRAVAGNIELDLSAPDEITFISNVKANITQSAALTIGTAAGNRALIWMPNVQLINHKKVDQNGRRFIGFDLRVTPTVSGSGNDELRLIYN